MKLEKMMSAEKSVKSDEGINTLLSADINLSKNNLNLVLNCDIAHTLNNNANNASNLDIADTKDNKNNNSCSENKENLVLNQNLQHKKILHLKKTPRKKLHENIIEKFVEKQKEMNEINEIVKAEEFDKRLAESSSQNKMRLAISLLLRIVMPLANGFANRIKGFRTDHLWRILRNLGGSKQALANLFASAANTISMGLSGLSSVQVSHRIDPLLKIMKIRKVSPICTTVPMIMPTSTSTDSDKTIFYNSTYTGNIPRIFLDPPETYETAEECITINVLAEPPPDTKIRADIIFIHGLHGCLKNTWKQGLWSKERIPVEFDRPPKPPLRPPKRPRHSRSNIFVPAHSNKKVRLEYELFNTLQDDDDGDSDILTHPNNDKINYNNFSSIDSYDSFNFSTFRLRLEDYENTSRPTSPTQSQQFERSENNQDKSLLSDKSDKQEPYSYCWPGDWLPLDCPGVRVIAVDYTTDPHLWRPVWIKKHHRSSMTERVRVITKRLIEKKVGDGHPIIWVGHSKGGLYIKQILVDAWESGKPSLAPLIRSSKGVFFYSVPHRGSLLADINLPFVRRSIELVEIEKNSKVLLDLHRRFVSLYYSGHLKIEVFSFAETALTFMQFLYLRIVGVDSSDPSIGNVCGLRLDHREICKPRSRKCILYTELVKMINKVS